MKWHGTQGEWNRGGLRHGDPASPIGWVPYLSFDSGHDKADVGGEGPEQGPEQG